VSYQDDVLNEFAAAAEAEGFQTTLSKGFSNVGDLIVYKGSVANVITSLNFYIDSNQSKILMDGNPLGPGDSSILWHPAKTPEKLAVGLAWWKDLLAAKAAAQ
jgi:hypothetical protein